jgi:predicted RecB family nuclease
MALQGIGPAWAQRLVDAGVTTIAQLAAMSATDLEATLLRSYEQQGAGEEQMLLFQRTLPARCKRLTEAARRATRAL